MKVEVLDWMERLFEVMRRDGGPKTADTPQACAGREDALLQRFGRRSRKG